MTNHLVAQLRTFGKPSKNKAFANAELLCRQAADEIERLARENEALRHGYNPETVAKILAAKAGAYAEAPSDPDEFMAWLTSDEPTRKHPVDALKEWGAKITPNTEAELRKICDEFVRAPNEPTPQQTTDG